MYKVINRNTNCSCVREPQSLTMEAALRLYDSLGGNAKGWAVVKIK